MSMKMKKHIGAVVLCSTRETFWNNGLWRMGGWFGSLRTSPLIRKRHVGYNTGNPRGGLD